MVDENSSGSSPWRIYMLLAGGMILFGSATPVSKIVTEAMPVFIASLFRVSLGAIALAPFAAPHIGALHRLSRDDMLALGGIAVFGMIGFSALMLYGMKMISGVSGAVVMAMAPAVTAFGAVTFFGESPTRRKVLAVMLAVAGVALLYLRGDDANAGQNQSGSGRLLGMVLIFGAVCCEAAYTLLGRKVSQDIPPVLVAFVASAAAIPLFSVLAAFQWSNFSPGEIGVGDWAAVAWYGAGTLALGTALWYGGVSRTEGSVAAVFMGLMPLSALILSYGLLGEAFRWMHLGGFGLVFASVMLISREHMREG